MYTLAEMNIFMILDLLLSVQYLIGHNYHGHNFHAEDLCVNNYVRKNITCGIKVSEIDKVR